MLQTEAYHTIVIYDHKTFMVQTTGVDHTEEINLFTFITYDNVTKLYFNTTDAQAE
jgi:hypothetical protein